MSLIFDKEQRMRAYITFHKQSMLTPENYLAFEYLKALEDVARMAVDYAVNSTPSNAVRLDNALATVDRMRI